MLNKINRKTIIKGILQKKSQSQNITCKSQDLSDKPLNKCQIKINEKYKNFQSGLNEKQIFSEDLKFHSYNQLDIHKNVISLNHSKSHKSNSKLQQTTNLYQVNNQNKSLLNFVKGKSSTKKVCISLVVIFIVVAVLFIAFLTLSIESLSLGKYFSITDQTLRYQNKRILKNNNKAGFNKYSNKVSYYDDKMDQTQLEQNALNNQNILQKGIVQSQDEFDWPQENEPYHIYPSVNSRLVLDVAKANDGFHDLILYQWQNSTNQMYYFQRVNGNFYHIINAQSKQYMKISQKIIEQTGVNKVKFQQEQDKLWQLVPANKNIKNAFYILTPQRKSLDLNKGYANNGGQIIVYDWNKNDNQIWYLRKNQQYIDPEQYSREKYQQRAAQLLQKITHNLNNINDCIQLEEIKKEMVAKNMPLPSWLGTPQIPQIDNSYYSQQIVAQFNKKIITTSNIPEGQRGKETHQNMEKNNENHQKLRKISLQCAKNHTIAYIWYGEKELLPQYQQLLQKCENNTKLLTEKDYFYYIQKWNQLQPLYAVDSQDFTIRQKINLLKLLYLYFESGIYADFDTEIHQKCFQNIFTDEIIFTNRMDENVDYKVMFAVEEIIVPEENFMMIRRKFHPQVKRMLQQEIFEHNERGGRRWRECKYRQCLILQCQRHYRDNTYKKGFD